MRARRRPLSPPSAELLEPRRLLASISGRLFNDTDADGVIDAGENGLSGWTVYQDANLNGVRDISAPTTFNSADVPKALVDSGTVNSTNVVSGLTGVIADVNVTIDLTHTWDGDLVISLLSPTGQQIFLANQAGGAGNDGDNYTNTTFDDEASLGIESGTAPYTGSFRPFQSLSLVDGGSPNGTWTLRVSDVGALDTGTLLSWSIAIRTGETFTFTNSSGDYGFSSQAAGTYRIREEIQSPYLQTSPAGGFHDVTVGPSDNATGRNFGNRLPPGEIRGVKWKDLDDDGVKDAGEPGLAGVTVYVDTDLDGIKDTGERSAVTASDGTYAITEVPPGNHIVREVLPGGYVQTFPTAFGAVNAPTTKGEAAPVELPSPALAVPTPPGGKKMRPVWAEGTDEEVIEAFYETPKPAGHIGAFTYGDSNRWSRTATNGPGLVQGQATTLTWNVVADGTFIPGFIGEANSNSNLRAFLTGIYGTQAAWMAIFQQVFDSWSTLTGINYVYENADDGSAFSDVDDNTTEGVLGTRADIRIGGHTIDGNSNVLAYNFFPGNGGEMVLDTSDNFFVNFSGGSNVAIRNTIAHEHGHGIGLEHVMPTDQTKLMEPFISFAFDGPQHDDVLAANRGYGDRFEKSGGNDTIALGTNLGSLVNSTSNTTGVSIDDNSDTDVFRFTVGTTKRATINLSPVGSTYLSGSQFGAPPTNFNSLAQSDLTLQLIAPDGTTVVATANFNAAGLGETLSNVPLGAGGQYYVKITGAADAAQLYNLSVTIADALGGAHSVTVGIAQIVNNINFGNVPVVFNGSGNNDVYHLAAINSGATLLVEETLNGGPMTTYNLAMSLVNSTGVTVHGGGGADAVLLDQSGSLPPLNIDGGSGVTDSLVVIGDYTGASTLGSWNGSAYTGTTGMIATGKIRKNSPRDVGIAEASFVLGLSGSQTALWHGKVVDATSVLISSTPLGDANLSGTIDADDYFQIDSNHNKPAASLGYSKGDFDYDGDIDGDDFFIIDDNFSAAQVASPPAASAAATSSSGAELPGANVFSGQPIESAYRRLADDESA